MTARISRTIHLGDHHLADLVVVFSLHHFDARPNTRTRHNMMRGAGSKQIYGYPLEMRACGYSHDVCVHARRLHWKSDGVS